ncbi:MAG TPA: GntR family transcriptional regulator [Atribacteraceae bacterium]|nr:GntR family transcriptional regulator [Atribacteraceae bacterium]
MEIKKTTLVDQAYQRVRQLLMDGELEPGQPLVQDELARKLGISRTPVMHVIRELENDGLVVRQDTNRVFVRELSLDEMVVIWEIRIALEKLACKYVAPVITREKIACLRSGFDRAMQAQNRDEEYRRMDNTFHISLAETCPSRDLADILIRSGFMVKGLLKGLLRPPEETYPEHMKILESLEKRDSVGAVESMAVHLERTLRHILKLKSEGG